MALVIFIYGLLFGSFFNVVIYRLPLNKSIIYPASACPNCKKNIKWYDNIPVLSYIILGGKCRNCKTYISIRYPLIELLSGIIALLLYLKFNFSIEFFYYYIWLSILLIISFIDIDHMIIPDSLSVGGTIFFLLFNLILSLFLKHKGEIIYIKYSFLGALIGFLFMFLIGYLYKKFSGIDGLGGGDIKLTALNGAILGPFYIFLSIFLASILAIIFYSLNYLFFNKKAMVDKIDLSKIEDEDEKNIKKELNEWLSNYSKDELLKYPFPFGPFLILGAVIMNFFGSTIINFYTKLFNF